LAERAVVLLSGGMDSAVCAAWAAAERFAVVALTVDYGQRHRAELGAAAAVARRVGAAEHLVVKVDLRAIGGSALTAEVAVPKRRAAAGAPPPGEAVREGGAREGAPGGAGPPGREGREGGSVPTTYVPARNTVLLALALGVAETRGCGAIVIGANRIDYSGYPDCRPAFLEAFGRLAAVATAAGLEGRVPRIVAPLLDLSKREIVELGVRLGAPFDVTLSCYDPSPEGVPCGACDACGLRAKGFREAGRVDPALP